MHRLKNIIDQLDITLLNAEFYKVGTEWNYQQVNNPYSRIYYITAGHGIIQHHDTEYELKPGSLYLIPCYTSVNMICPKSFTHYYLHFTTRLPTGMDILALFDCTYCREAQDHNISRSLFNRLLELNPNRALTEYNANQPIYQQVLDRAIQLDQAKPMGHLMETNGLMRLLLASFFAEETHPQMHNTLDGLQRFAPVFAYIQENLQTPLTLQQLANCVDLNPTYFSNLFSKLMGVTPIQYINRRRVEEVQIRLLSTDNTLKEIALDVGFADEYYLSRVFKQLVGISPRHYRQQNLEMHKR